MRRIGELGGSLGPFSPPQSTVQLASHANIYFFTVSACFFVFFLHCGAWSQATPYC